MVNGVHTELCGDGNIPAKPNVNARNNFHGTAKLKSVNFIRQT